MSECVLLVTSCVLLVRRLFGKSTLQLRRDQEMVTRTLKKTAIAVISGNLHTSADGPEKESVRPSARRPPVQSILHQRTAI